MRECHYCGPILLKSWRINPASRIAAALLDAALNSQLGVHIVSSSELV